MENVPDEWVNFSQEPTRRQRQWLHNWASHHETWTQLLTRDQAGELIALINRLMEECDYFAFLKEAADTDGAEFSL